MADPVAKANAAMVDEDFEAAVEFYDEAIDASPRDAALYTARAQAHIQLENWLDAAEDASQALTLDPRLSKAHFRKGVASFELEEFETAKAAFEKAAALDPKLKAVKGWIAKCYKELNGGAEPAETERASQRAAVNGTTSPDAAKVLVPSVAAAPQAAAPVAPVSAAQLQQPKQPPPAVAPAASAPIVPSAVPERPTKYRHQWLQTPTHVEVAVLAKKLTRERVSVSIEADQLTVVVRDEAGAEEYQLATPLYSRVLVEECRWELLSTKVEVRLKKAATGTWPSLEARGAEAPANWSAPTAPPVKVYPSSRPQVVDWNKIEAEVTKEEKEEELDGDAGVQKLFRSIYAGADENMRRAMNKSFQESNGTVLSTSWADIGSKKTEFKAPEGADIKKFEY